MGHHIFYRILMMNSKVLFILILVSISAADKQPSELYGPPKIKPASSEYYSDESTETANYNFEFVVDDGYSGADFNHHEEREDDNTQGSYSVQLPDGRRQIVKYHVDGDSGYVAEVTYEGEAHYYEPEESEESSESAPIYAAPKPKPKPTQPPRRPSYSAPKPRPIYSDVSDESEEEKEEEKPKASYGSPSRSYGAPQ